MEENKLEWFEPKNLNEEQQKAVQAMREAFRLLGASVALHVPGGRRQAIVWTHLEEAAHMATKAISHG